MATTLHCECGAEVHLTDEEARDITWCPRCRKMLTMPEQYIGSPKLLAIQKPAAAPRSTGAGGEMSWRWVIPLIVVGLGVARASCWSSRQSTTPPNYPTYTQPTPQVPRDWQQFQQPNDPRFQRPDNRPDLNNPADWPNLNQPGERPDPRNPGNLPNGLRPGDRPGVPRPGDPPGLKKNPDPSGRTGPRS